MSTQLYIGGDQAIHRSSNIIRYPSLLRLLQIMADNIRRYGSLFIPLLSQIHHQRRHVAG
jgi:hypothetical protein